MKKFLTLVTLILVPIFSQAQSYSIKSESQDQYLRYDFGLVGVNFRETVDFTLTAKGPEPTLLKSITIGGQMYYASSNCPDVLPVGKACTTRVSFWPSRDGFYPGQLNFYMADSAIYIDLAGWGRL